MVGVNIELTNQWVKLSNNEDYIIQNKSSTLIYVAASATIPSSIDIAIELESKGVLTSSLMPGVIWAKTIKGTAAIVCAK